VIILDSAPTGETLRFLSLPEIAEWWFRKIFPIQKKVVQVVRPAVKKVTNFPLPEDETYDAGEKLFESLYSLHKLMQNHEISTIRIVTNPEKMVLKETQRAFTYLHLFGYPIDAIVVNRIIKGKLFKGLSKIQREYLLKIEDFFSPIPILKVPFYGEEITGIKKLLKLGKDLYKDKNPADIFYKDIPLEFKKDKKGYKIILKIKEIKKDKVNILQKDEEITLTVGNFRKYIYLPRNLINYRATQAKIQHDNLVIFLEK
jgi:arsenite-transporting ATPase